MRKIKPAPATEMRICKVCKKPFHCHPREWAHSFRKRDHCSQACGRVTAARKHRYLTSQDCLHCGDTFRPEVATRKYCSHECYWASKKGQPPPYVPPDGRRTLICEGCQKPFETITYYAVTRHRRFCSRACYHEFMRGNTPDEWLSSDALPFYRTKEWKRLRKQVKACDKNTCRHCGIRARGARRLIVHHVRPRHTFGIRPQDVAIHPKAEALPNLITICYPCHYKVHFGPR